MGRGLSAAGGSTRHPLRRREVIPLHRGPVAGDTAWAPSSRVGRTAESAGLRRRNAQRIWATRGQDPRDQGAYFGVGTFFLVCSGGGGSEAALAEKGLTMASWVSLL